MKKIKSVISLIVITCIFTPSVKLLNAATLKMSKIKVEKKESSEGTQGVRNCSTF